MTRKTDSDETSADLATVESLLGAVPEGDVLGRRSLKARRDLLVQELATLTAQPQRGASVRVVIDDLDRSFDASAALGATERTQGTLSEEQDVPVVGEFLGVLPERRTFEFRRDDGTVLRGRVSEEMQPADLRQLNPTWSTRRCIAHLRIVTLTSPTRSRQRYLLRRLVPEPSP
jgi:hypothetical protein